MCEYCEEHWVVDEDCWGCENIFNNRKFVEKSLDNYAYEGTQAWISDGNHLNVFTVDEKDRRFISTKGEFEINYCPMCGRDLRGDTNEKGI